MWKDTSTLSLPAQTWFKLRSESPLFKGWCNAAADRSRPIRLLSTTGSAGEAYCTWCILFNIILGSEPPAAKAVHVILPPPFLAQARKKAVSSPDFL
jgi:hypothetical protein